MRLIMTPRDDLRSCRLTDPIASVVTDNVERYSFLPVRDEDERICGLFQAEHWRNRPLPSKPVREDESFEQLRESHLIGDDANVLHFIETCRERPVRLVVSETRIVGLVCSSDLHKLPVRAAIFSIITALEIAMADRIQEKWSDPEHWLGLLCHQRRKEVKKTIRRTKKGDTFVSDILCTQFADKADIVRCGHLLGSYGPRLESDFKAIRDLRNQLVHGSDYAATNDAAKDTADNVRRILKLIDLLSDKA